MHVQHVDRFRGIAVAGVKIGRSRQWNDRGNEIGVVTSHAVGHEPTVGNTREVDAQLVHGVLGLDALHELPEVARVVNIRVEEVAAGIGGVPEW